MADALPAWDDTEETTPSLPVWEETEPLSEYTVLAPAPSVPALSVPTRPASRGFQAVVAGEQADMDFRVGEYVNQFNAQTLTEGQDHELNREAFFEGAKRGLAGMEQLGIRALEAVGVLPSGSTEDFTAKENVRQADYDYAARFGNTHARTVNRIVGELTPSAPLAFMPGGGALKASDAVRKGAGLWNTTKGMAYRSARVGIDAAAGSVPGMVQYAQSDAERVTNMALGALVSGGVRAGVEVLQMLNPRTIAQNMMGVEAALSTKTAADGRALESKVGPLSLSQLTGSPDVLASELLARRGKGVNDIIAAGDAVPYSSALKYFKKEADAAYGAGLPGEQVGERVKAGFQKAVDAITTTRRNNWTFDMALARQAGGARKFIASDRLKAELLGLARELGDPLADEGSKAVARELYKDLVYIGYGRQITPAKITGASRAGYPKVTGPGQLSVEQAETLLKKYTDWSTKSGRPLKDAETGADRFVGARLKDALLKDLDTTAAATPNDKAVIALKRARENYRLASEDLNALGNEVVTQLLDRNKVPAVENFADIFKRPSITPSQIRGTIEVLNKHDPMAVKLIQRKWVDDALDTAAKVDPERLPGSAEERAGFDPVTFWNAMNFDSPAAREVFTGADRVRFQTGMEYVRRIFPLGHGKVVVPEGGTRDIAQAAMNLTSLNMIFVMGQIARTAAPHAFAKAMFTEQGVNALKIIAEPKRYPPTVLANAALFIKSLEGDAHESRNQEKTK